MRHALVTHLDSVIGRRLAKALYHDPDVALVVGVGTSPTPSYLGAYSEKIYYQRLDLAKARHVHTFFQSELFLRAGIDSVIHLPFVRERNGERIPGNVPSLVSETRRLIEGVKKHRRIERFVYLSSGFVYRPEPGNGNVVTEQDPLDFEADADPEVRAWIDTDLLCQTATEQNGSHLQMTILRAATIVTEAGAFLQSPPLRRRTPPTGFDPMLSLVSERDVARALVLALHSERGGVFNVAGTEVFPHSQLRPHSRSAWSLPATFFGTVTSLGQAIGLGSSKDAALQRYGLVLDTRLATEALGFEPQYRVELRGAGEERRIDTVRCR